MYLAYCIYVHLFYWGGIILHCNLISAVYAMPCHIHLAVGIRTVLQGQVRTLSRVLFTTHFCADFTTAKCRVYPPLALLDLEGCDHLLGLESEQESAPPRLVSTR